MGGLIACCTPNNPAVPFVTAALAVTIYPSALRPVNAAVSTADNARSPVRMPAYRRMAFCCPESSPAADNGSTAAAYA